MRTIAQSLILRFSSEGRCGGARLAKSSNRFTAYSSYPIELKLCRMMLVISLHNRSPSDFSISPRGRCGGAPLEILNRFTAYKFYLIELKLDRMILDISPLDRSELDFSISSRGRCGSKRLEIFKSIHGLQYPKTR